MKKSILAFIVTILIGFVGIYIGALMNLEGYLGVVFAIATIGAFIISCIEKNRP